MYDEGLSTEDKFTALLLGLFAATVTIAVLVWVGVL